MVLRLVLISIYGLLIGSGASLIARRAIGCEVNTVAQPRNPACSGSESSTILAALQRSQDATYRAARTLDAAHRLRADDLLTPDDLRAGLSPHLSPKSALVGKYLRKSVARGWDIAPSNLSSIFDPAIVAKDPAIVAKTAAALLVWLGEGQAKLAAVLDVGWTVDLCDDQGCVVKGGKVLGLDCQTTGDDACALVLSVKPNERQDFLNLKRKDKLVITISEPKPGG
jgi:hypothetical protein